MEVAFAVATVTVDRTVVVMVAIVCSGYAGVVVVVYSIVPNVSLFSTAYSLFCTAEGDRGRLQLESHANEHSAARHGTAQHSTE